MTLFKAVARFKQTKYFPMKGSDFLWLGHGPLSGCWLEHPRYLHEGTMCVLHHGVNHKVTLVHLLCFSTPLQAVLAAEVCSHAGRAASLGLPQPGLQGGSEGQSCDYRYALPQRHEALDSKLRLCRVVQEPCGELHGMGQGKQAANQAEGCPEEPVVCSYLLILVGQIPQIPDTSGVTPQWAQAGS